MLPKLLVLATLRVLRLEVKIGGKKERLLYPSPGQMHYSDELKMFEERGLGLHTLHKNSNCTARKIVMLSNYAFFFISELGTHL